MMQSRKLIYPIIAIVVVFLSVSIFLLILPFVFPPPPRPTVELTNLKIGGQEREASAKNGDYTDITFALKNNDGKDHQVTVVFELTTEGIRHVSITDQARQVLSSSDTRFQYSKTIGSTDPFLNQRVLAQAHMQGLSSVSVEIKIFLVVDGKISGDPQNLALRISK